MKIPPLQRASSALSVGTWGRIKFSNRAGFVDRAIQAQHRFARDTGVMALIRMTPAIPAIPAIPVMSIVPVFICVPIGMLA
jgi:hypothetical protein